MVKEINTDKDIEYIIEQVKCRIVNITDKDTIIITIDPDKYDIDIANQILDSTKKTFPNNKILVIFNGIELGIVRFQTL